MPVTKITLSTAMRARDVSRPHEEHLTEAADRENKVHENTGREKAVPENSGQRNTGREGTTTRQAETPPRKPAPPLPGRPSPLDQAPARRRRRRRS